MDTLYDDHHDDGLDLFATPYEEVDVAYELIVSKADYIGWISMKDLAFLEDIVTCLNKEGIKFNYFVTGIIKMQDVIRMSAFLDEFVANKNLLSRSDIGLNRSVRRLRAVIKYVVDKKSNLLIVSD